MSGHSTAANHAGASLYPLGEVRFPLRYRGSVVVDDQECDEEGRRRDREHDQMLARTNGDVGPRHLDEVAAFEDVEADPSREGSGSQYVASR